MFQNVQNPIRVLAQSHQHQHHHEDYDVKIVVFDDATFNFKGNHILREAMPYIVMCCGQLLSFYLFKIDENWIIGFQNCVL